jgi:hypothetical protein
VAIKTRWRIAVDPAEHTAITEVLAACLNIPIEVKAARQVCRGSRLPR